MEVIRGLENWKPVRNPVVTVGSFDGVHVAHKAVINLLNHYADVDGGESVLVTFSPHPRMVLHASDAYDHRFRLLTTDEEKVSLLAKTGLGRVLIIHFDEAFSEMSYSAFIEKVLVGTLGVKRMVVGYNHNFGHDRKGSYDQMQEYGRKHGFEVDRFPEQLFHHQHLSSTRIRSLLLSGHIAMANEFLGYNYGIHGHLKGGAFIPDNPYKLLPASSSCLVKVKKGDNFNFTVCECVDYVSFPDLKVLKEGDALKVEFIKEVSVAESGLE